VHNIVQDRPRRQREKQLKWRMLTQTFRTTWTKSLEFWGLSPCIWRVQASREEAWATISTVSPGPGETETERQRERETERQRDRERDREVRRFTDPQQHWRSFTKKVIKWLSLSTKVDANIFIYIYIWGIWQTLLSKGTLLGTFVERETAIYRCGT